MNETDIIKNINEAVVKAGSTYCSSKMKAIKRLSLDENDPVCKSVVEMLVDNAVVAEREQTPLCDDTGIPHIVIDVGRNMSLSYGMVSAIKKGVAKGLEELPGRPMALIGDDIQRIEQSAGIFERSDALEIAPVSIRTVDEPVIRVHVLLLGGGPEIRSKTYRVFHKHDIQVVKDEIISWAGDAAADLGCTPCTLAIGIGRTHYEAATLSLYAQIDGRYEEQSDLEKEITQRVNDLHIGPMGLGGNATVMASFIKVGPQRASGVRMVSLRPCCCMEPRIATVDIV